MAGVPVIVSEGNEQCRLVTAERVGACVDIDDSGRHRRRLRRPAHATGRGAPGPACALPPRGARALHVGRQRRRPHRGLPQARRPAGAARRRGGGMTAGCGTRPAVSAPCCRPRWSGPRSPGSSPTPVAGGPRRPRARASSARSSGPRTHRSCSSAWADGSPARGSSSGRGGSRPRPTAWSRERRGRRLSAPQRPARGASPCTAATARRPAGSTSRRAAAGGPGSHPRFVRSGPSDTRYGERDYDYAVITTSESCTYPGRAVLRLWPTSFADGQLASGSGSRWPATRPTIASRA